MKQKPYFNSLQELYQGRQPPIYDTSFITGIDRLEDAANAIRDELYANLADDHRAAICFDKWALQKQKGWRQIELQIYGVDYPKRCRLFPKTMSAIQGIPGVATAYFSLLSPQTSIAPHTGDTDAYYRVHLGLKVPSALPSCGIEVAGQQLPWQQDRCIAFNDIYCHTAWNHTNEDRIVLIVDILRPEFRDREVYVYAGVRATLYYLRLYAIFFPIIELMPRILTRLGRPVFHYISYAYHLSRLKLSRIRTTKVNQNDK